MQFSIQLPKTISIKYCCVKKQSFFLISNNIYFFIPRDYTFLLENNLLTFSCFNKSILPIEFKKFVSSLFRLLKKNGSPFLKKLLFKGLGLKAALLDVGSNKVLELKLGFSHLIRIIIPQTKIGVKLIKNGLLVSGSDLVTVSNFLYKIKSLKLPNRYKGKGIWYKNEVIKLKEIKKS